MIRVRNDRGFVSLFTCIMISLLLMVITLSMISIQTLQLRKAEDAEQALRAYYTAEAGVEDAVSKVLAQVSSGAALVDQACQANASYDIPGAAGWTCQQISFSGTPFGKLDSPDMVKTVDPGVLATPFRSVVIQWNQSTNTSAGFYNMPAALPNQATGAANYAAPIELSIVEYPTGGFAAGDPGLKLQNVVIRPGGGGGGPATINYSSAGFKTGSPYAGNCTALPHSLPGGYGAGTSTNYNCHAILTNMDPSKAYIFRIRSKYTASAFRMVFHSAANGTGSVVTVPDGTATIDVTAKAGQTYRRVISKLPLNKGGAAGLNYVMYSDNDICKNFVVFDNNPQSGCPYP